jgi:ketosteroid isomerase-like protein
LATSNARTVRAAYDALNEGDSAAALAALDEQAEWCEHSDLPEAGFYRGRESIDRFLADFLESWEEFHQEVEDVREVADKVLVMLDMHGRGRGSGIEVQTSYAHVWTMRSGRGVRVDAYYDRDEALAALEARAS